MNLPQRVAVLIAWAAALWVLGWAVLVEYPSSSGGWTNYSPNNALVAIGGYDDGLRFEPAVSAAIGLGLIGAWLALALWLLRDRRPPTGDDRPPG